MAEDGDKTEAPSERRLAQARRDGDVAVSRELSGVVGLAVGLGVLASAWGGGGRGLAMMLRNLVEQSGTLRLDGDGLRALLVLLVRDTGAVLMPVLCAPVAGVAAASLLQSGFLLRIGGLVPDPGRISPMRGLARLASPHSLVETGKSLLKLGASAAVIWFVAAGALPAVARAGQMTLVAMMSLLVRVLVRVAIGLLAVQFAVSVLDAAWLRIARARKLRMTRQEVRDEHRDSEGNPQIKARIRALRGRRARQRMMLAVPKAAVVLTNPTHYAVALAYEQGSRAAPRIVAKGADEVAARIREAARRHRVPLVANPPLARALFTVPLEQEVPRELFQAVAAVIAYVWRLDQERRAPAR